MVFRITLESGRSKASLTNMVLQSWAARMVLTAVTLFRSALLGAPSLGNRWPMFSSSSTSRLRIDVLTRSSRDPYLCGPGRTGSSSEAQPWSASSSAISLSWQPAWLLTLTSFNRAFHWWSSWRRGKMTSKWMISRGSGQKSDRPHFCKICSRTRQSINTSNGIARSKCDLALRSR